MKSRFDFQREGAVKANSVRALVATLCVLGLLSLTLFHSNDDARMVTGFADSTQSATDASAAHADFLRAPTSDPSLPSLESAFSGKDVTPGNDVPPATF